MRLYVALLCFLVHAFCLPRHGSAFSMRSTAVNREGSVIPRESVFSSWYSEVLALVDAKDPGWKSLEIPGEYGGGGNAKIGVLGARGAGQKEIAFVSEAFSSSRLEYARMVSFCGSGYDVFNLLLMPKLDSCLPIFGADIVCLPGGALAAIDFQPARDGSVGGYYESKLYAPHKDIFAKWQKKLPPGGELPEAAQKYFSPHAIWTRIPPPLESNVALTGDVKYSLLECLGAYLDDLNFDYGEASLKPDPAFLEGYLRYRIENDPAKNLLIGAFGKAWTDDVLEKVLFPSMTDTKGRFV